MNQKDIDTQKMVDLKDVVTVYLGKPNKCMCGCSGDYAYTSHNHIYGGKDRGYKVSSDEISDRKVRARLKRFYNDDQEAENIKDYIFTKVIDDRQITVYLKREEK